MSFCDNIICKLVMFSKGIKKIEIQELIFDLPVIYD